MLCSLLFFAQVQGHVKFFFSDDTHDLLARPIRNAPAANSDGVMSTSGPCGSNTANWGANGFSYAREADVVTMKINYNGGHKTAANKFRAAWNCAADGTNELPQTMLLPNAAGVVALTSCTTPGCPEPVTGVNYECGASQGNDHTPGYIFKCPIPTGTAGKNCTISVLTQSSQGDWGGCYDLMVENTPPTTAIGGGATPSPIGTVDTSVIGMYLTTAASTEVIENRPAVDTACCELAYGSFFVFEMDGGMQAIADVKAACDGQSFVHNSVVDLVKDQLGPVWRADIVMGVPANEQLYELSLSDGLLLITQLDPGPNKPQFCDFAVSRKSTGNSAGRPVLSAVAMMLTIVTTVGLLF